MRIEAEGTFSEGFSTKVLPQAIATGNIHIGTMTGKLKGVIPAHTPMPCRTVWQSTPEPTFSECSPLRRCGMPQANSTTSSPRCTEPMASESVFPCSSVTSRASSCWLDCISCRNLCITRARRRGGVSRHAGYAAAAAFTAASTSAALQNGTRRVTAPVAGLVTPPKRVAVARRRFPSTHISTLATAFPSTGWFIVLSCRARERSHPAARACRGPWSTRRPAATGV